MSDRRTILQNKSMHKLFRLYADALNDGGFDQMAVLEKKTLPTPNTPESVKGLWHLVQAAMYPPEEGKVSTADLTTKEIQAVYETLNRFFANEFGVSIEWPSDEPPMIEDR